MILPVLMDQFYDFTKKKTYLDFYVELVHFRLE